MALNLLIILSLQYHFLQANQWRHLQSYFINDLMPSVCIPPLSRLAQMLDARQERVHASMNPYAHVSTQQLILQQGHSVLTDMKIYGNANVLSGSDEEDEEGMPLSGWPVKRRRADNEDIKSDNYVSALHYQYCLCPFDVEAEDQHLLDRSAGAVVFPKSALTELEVKRYAEERHFYFYQNEGMSQAATQLIVRHQHVFLITPTGSGKFDLVLLYAMLRRPSEQKQFILFVSPFASLIDDQLARCAQLGIKAARFSAINLHSDLAAHVDIMFVTPESSVDSEAFVKAYPHLLPHLALVVIDEIHLLQATSLDMEFYFRLAFVKLPRLFTEMRYAHRIQMLFMSATCPPSFVNEINRFLGLEFTRFQVIRTSAKRANLKYMVKKKGEYRYQQPLSIVDLNVAVEELLSATIERDDAPKVAVIFCNTLNDVEAIANAYRCSYLQNDNDFRLVEFTATVQDRQSVLEKLKRLHIGDAKNVIVLATTCFGTGINLSNIVVVIQHGRFAYSFCELLQQFGRAGRRSALGQSAAIRKCIMIDDERPVNDEHVTRYASMRATVNNINQCRNAFITDFLSGGQCIESCVDARAYCDLCEQNFGTKPSIFDNGHASSQSVSSRFSVPSLSPSTESSLTFSLPSTSTTPETSSRTVCSVSLAMTGSVSAFPNSKSSESSSTPAKRVLVSAQPNPTPASIKLETAITPLRPVSEFPKDRIHTTELETKILAFLDALQSYECRVCFASKYAFLRSEVVSSKHQCNKSHSFRCFACGLAGHNMKNCQRFPNSGRLVNGRMHYKCWLPHFVFNIKLHNPNYSQAPGRTCKEWWIPTLCVYLYDEHRNERWFKDLVPNENQASWEAFRQWLMGEWSIGDRKYRDSNYLCNGLYICCVFFHQSQEGSGRGPPLQPRRLSLASPFS
jgi:superfamily II DNA helicase RecQ